MTADKSKWADTLIHLFALACKLEGEGQYNLAKLCRATADSLSRRAAYAIEIPSAQNDLVADTEQTIDALSKLDVDKNLIAAFQCGAAAMAQGRLALFNETPHPYVCRTCGHLTVGEPSEKCPTCGAWASTYQRFLPVYWLDALEPFATLEKLRQTPIQVESLLQGLPEDVLNQPASDGGWAIRNIVSHLRDAQGVISFRVELFLQDEHPSLESKAVFAWATNENERPSLTREIFETYKASRAEMISQLEKTPLGYWWRVGQHEEFGPVTLKQQVSYFASHELTHLPQIERLAHK
ncbi:MAG: DinB family protein [Chloroflexi bacterium]|nr:DinB family protein [Chloroflexota bacterium]